MIWFCLLETPGKKSLQILSIASLDSVFIPLKDIWEDYHVKKYLVQASP